MLGPHAWPADGNQDLAFTESLLDWLEDNYCVDTERVFATGHSWGGDMAMVVACFLGDRVRASIPVAANRPYWFEPDAGGWVDCEGDAAVWTMFGRGDTHFTWQDYAGQFGDQCNDFWVDEHTCDDSTVDLGYGAPDECRAWGGCSSGTRYCLYGAPFGHDLPNYYSDAARDWFRSF